MKVLVACEESQRVCTAFRAKGHEAYSCDKISPSGGFPEWHIKNNALAIINGGSFRTMDGSRHQVDKWDLIIAHPPCTYICAASAIRLFGGNKLNMERWKKLRLSAKFFRAFLEADCDRICVENPVPLEAARLPQYTQIIQPYYFGDPWQKKTCLWLKGLPPLVPTNPVVPKGYWIGAHGRDKAPNGMSKGFRNSQIRSRTFIGIAKAMAEQWG